MNTPLTHVRNLGPVTARMLAEVDIPSAEILKETGAIEAYHRLKFRFGHHVSIVALYAMEAGLRDCDWRNLPMDVKAELKKAAAAR